jgi:AcrR family transcriptional regulator
MKSSEEKIINAAIILFGKNLPFTMEDVAQLAGVSRRTLQRYFSGKNELLTACKDAAMSSCNSAMVNAYNSNTDNVKKLQAMLSAVIESGSKSVFIKRLYERSSYTEAGGNDDFKGDDVKSKWVRIIYTLQEKGVISKQLSVVWIFNLFGSIADAAILSIDNGDIARNEAKRFAWFSFSNGIGLKENRSK